MCTGIYPEGRGRALPDGGDDFAHPLPLDSLDAAVRPRALAFVLESKPGAVDLSSRRPAGPAESTAFPRGKASPAVLGAGNL